MAYKTLKVGDIVKRNNTFIPKFRHGIGIVVSRGKHHNSYRYLVIWCDSDYLYRYQREDLLFVQCRTPLTQMIAEHYK
jgi:hypothetical protein